MASTLLLTSLLAVAAVASPTPARAPSFGNKAGNFQPERDVSGNVTRRDTGEWVSMPNLAYWNNANIEDGVGDGVDKYVMYWGNGEVSSGWPAKSKWVSFDNMFNNNKNTMFSSCSWFGQADNSGPEIGSIWNAIQQVSQQTGVDHRFVLAVILQESGGCVRVPTTNYGVRNPGLMQDHNGAATCNENGVITNPCPQSTITQMITDGTAGTSSGDGLANCINEAANWNTANSDVSSFYKAARIYNSGSIASSGNLQDGIATHCYASDIANRLTGWVSAASQCNLD